jgi:uncharacterized OB-fold protein
VDVSFFDLRRFDLRLQLLILRVMPLHPDYPLPEIDNPITQPFWEGCRAHRLMLQREVDTGIVHWPPKPAYWKGGGKLQWFEANGRGDIYSYVIGHAPFLPAFEHLLPLIMVLVQLDEGPRLVGYMVNCRPEEMTFGMRVRVVFKKLTDLVTLPVWEPDR